MSEIALSMEHVYKKFRKGETYNSLRDLLPALTGKILRGEELNAKDRREFWALQDVSFEVKRGEALGIIGHNGAGKSTILKILSRIMKPTCGRMIVNGRLSALIEVAAGFHPDLTGMENIFLHGTILGMTKTEIQSKLDQIIAFSGIEEFIDTPVKRYSSGMYARLGFSVAAHIDPDVLVVDEVLSVGDYAFQRKCIDRIRSVIALGTTVLFVSHNLKSVTDICQRVMLLGDGKVTAIDEPNVIAQRYLGGLAEAEADDDKRPVCISKITIRDGTGEQTAFESGQTAWVDIEVVAREATDRLAVVIWFSDEMQYEIFNTSTERLGSKQISLGAGGSHRCTFEIRLNMAHGTFYLGADVYCYHRQKSFDRHNHAATIFIEPCSAVQGVANCFPELVVSETVGTSSQYCQV
jgi:ABC-type polysaccharide/polyol phosphate transport system ATPase subunit